MTADRQSFDPKTVKVSVAYDTVTTLHAVCLDEAARTLRGAGMDGALHSVDLAAAKPAAVKRWPLHDNYVSSIAQNGMELISSGYDRNINWTDLKTGKRIRSAAAHDGWVRKLVTVPGGKRLVTVGDDMLVKVWEAEGKPIASLAGHAKQVPEGYLSSLYALAVSPDGKYAASGDRAGFVRVWDLETSKPASEFRAIDFYTFDPVKRARAIGGVRGLAFSPDGSRLAVSGIGAVTNVDGFVGPCRIELWDWKAAKRLGVGQDKHQSILNHVAFGPTGSWVIGAGGGDGGGGMMFWDSASNAAPHIARPKGHVHAFVLNASGSRLYAAGHGGFQVWQLRTDS